MNPTPKAVEVVHSSRPDEPYLAVMHREGVGRPGGIFSTPSIFTLVNPRKDRRLAGKKRRLARKAASRG